MDTLTVKSSRGEYKASFVSPFTAPEWFADENLFFLVDANVAKIYGEQLRPCFRDRPVLLVEATERNKSLGALSGMVKALLDKEVRRGHVMVAIGGGIVGDIASFIASILFRGIRWRFWPTTLVSQADSCIGGKGALNVESFKNQIGVFNPPEQIYIAVELLKTLSENDFRSGMGEVIKAHLIGGEGDWNWLTEVYDSLGPNSPHLRRAILRSLEIKKEFVEKDEFDLSERRILNYGHTFGHALEAASNYKIPHGIAVSMGMDMANYFSVEFGLMSKDNQQRIHNLLKKNHSRFEAVAILENRFFDAIVKDKKRGSKQLILVLMKNPGNFIFKNISLELEFMSFCRDLLKKWHGTTCH